MYAWLLRVQLIWYEMPVVGSESMNGVKILQLLQSGYQEFLRYAIVMISRNLDLRICIIRLAHILFLFYLTLV